MSRIVRTTDASYKIAVASGGVITLDTGSDDLGSVAVVDHLTVGRSLTVTGDIASNGSISAANDINAGGNVTGTWVGNRVDVAYGGTGKDTLDNGGVLIGNGMSPISSILPGASGNVLTSDGSSWISKETVPTSYKKVTTSYSAKAGDKLIVDSTAGSFTVLLPSTPVVGDYINAVDGGNWGTNNVIFDRNGQTINGVAEDLLADVGNLTVDLIYDGSTWKAFVSPYPPELPPILGNTGKFLYTNGLQVSWEPIPDTITITDDTTTDAVQYVSMVTSTSGVLTDNRVSSTKLFFNPSSGALTATEVNTLSDRTLKTDVNPIVDGIEIVRKINPVKFKWVSNNKLSAGVIAQEIEEILPEIVDTTASIKSVSYTQLIAYLISAIQTLDSEIQMLKQKLGDK